MQSAILEEGIKQIELDNLKQHLAEDSEADLEYQRLQSKVKEAQRAQEKALQAKEALNKYVAGPELLFDCLLVPNVDVTHLDNAAGSQTIPSCVCWHVYSSSTRKVSTMDPELDIEFDSCSFKLARSVQ